MKWRNTFLISLAWFIVIIFLFGLVVATSPKEETKREIQVFEEELIGEVENILITHVLESNLDKTFTFCENNYATITWGDASKKELYEINAARNISDVNGFLITIYINETLPYNGYEEEYAEQIKRVEKYIYELTKLKNLNLKDVEIGKFYLNRYRKKDIFFKNDYEFLGTSARMTYFKNYGPRNFRYQTSSEWPDWLGLRSAGARLCYPANIDKIEMFFDYDNNGVVDEKLSEKKEGFKPLLTNRTFISTQLLINQGFTFEEYEKANEWRKITSFIDEGAVSIPDSNDHFLIIREGSGFCNYIINFENSEFEVSLGVADVIEIRIWRKNEK